MNPSPFQRDPPADDVAWEEIETLLDEIGELVRQDFTTEQFERQLLERIVQATAAVGGCVWAAEGDGIRARQELNSQRSWTWTPAAWNAHVSLMESLFPLAELPMVPPGGSVGGSLGSATNDTPWLLLVCPVRLDGAPCCWIEVRQRADSAPSARRGYQKILTAACELAEDFYRRRELRELRGDATWLRAVLAFSRRLAGSLDLARTAYVVANECRTLVPAERSSVVGWRRSQATVLAISGVDLFDRRNETARSMERLVGVVLRTGEPLWFPQSTESLSPASQRSEPLSPEIETALEAYLDESHARTVAVVPLRAAESHDAAGDEATTEPTAGTPADRLVAESLVGALVVERFDGLASDAWRRRILDVARVGGAALGAAREYESTPFRRTWNRLRRLGWFVRARQAPRTAVVGVLLLAAIVALATIPADFTLLTRGEIQPRERRHLFAPADGVVGELIAPSDRANDSARSPGVRQGERLALLVNPQLDLQFSEVVGRRRTTQEELNAAETELLRAGGAQTPLTGQVGLSTRIEQLKQTLHELNQEHKILSDLRSRLDVRSPLDGVVLTWDVVRLLSARPVQRGERLMTVANLDGGWEVELALADRQWGHLRDALAASNEASPNSASPTPTLPVRFVLASRPGAEFVGTVVRVAEVAELDDAGAPIVRVTVDVDVRDATDAAAFAPGSSVVARIHCGRRSLGFVWLHELWETLERKLFF